METIASECKDQFRGTCKDIAKQYKTCINDKAQGIENNITSTLDQVSMDIQQILNTKKEDIQQHVMDNFHAFKESMENEIETATSEVLMQINTDYLKPKLSHLVKTHMEHCITKETRNSRTNKHNSIRHTQSTRIRSRKMSRKQPNKLDNRSKRPNNNILTIYRNQKPSVSQWPKPKENWLLQIL